MTGARDKINVISLNVKVNKWKLVHLCGYELPISVQNSVQKDSAKAKISLNVGGGLLFWLTLYICSELKTETKMIHSTVQGSQLSWNSWNFTLVLKLAIVLKFYSFGQNVLIWTFVILSLYFFYKSWLRLCCWRWVSSNVFSCDIVLFYV